MKSRYHNLTRNKVIHTASPFILDAKDFDKELYEPAVRGTVSVLEAVKKYNSDVKRIVITSSFASVPDFKKGNRPGHVYTEADWNPMTKEEARSAGPVAAYLVSKTLAERAAFDFVETEKVWKSPQSAHHFNLVFILAKFLNCDINTSHGIRPNRPSCGEH